MAKKQKKGVNVYEERRQITAQSPSGKWRLEWIKQTKGKPPKGSKQGSIWGKGFRFVASVCCSKGWLISVLLLVLG